jgi:hypothetical protein
MTQGQDVLSRRPVAKHDKDHRVPDTINLFHSTNLDRPLEDFVADLYGPKAFLGNEAATFLEAVDGKQPAAVQWNGGHWIFDREKIREWAITPPACKGMTLTIYLDPTTDRYGYSVFKDAKLISARHGAGTRFEVTKPKGDRGYEHRQVAYYWQDADHGTADIIDRGGVLSSAPPEEFRLQIVLTALENYTGASPFGEHRRFFQEVRVRPILMTGSRFFANQLGRLKFAGIRKSRAP